MNRRYIFGFCVFRTVLVDFCKTLDGVGGAATIRVRSGRGAHDELGDLFAVGKGVEGRKAECIIRCDCVTVRCVFGIVLLPWCEINVATGLLGAQFGGV